MPLTGIWNIGMSKNHVRDASMSIDVMTWSTTEWSYYKKKRMLSFLRKQGIHL